MRTERIVLLGAPASGKGTQVARLRDRFGFSVASTGQMLRDEENRGSEVGRLSYELSKTGTLAPDKVVLKLVEGWMAKNSSRVLFDGFPRTVCQAVAFGEVLGINKRQIDLVIELVIPESMGRERVSTRVTCQLCGKGVSMGLGSGAEACESCGGALVRRRDDSLVAFEMRMDQYREKTVPVINYYSDLGILRTVDGSGTPDEVFDLIIELVE